MMEFMKRLQHPEASGARSGSDASVNHRRHLHKHRSAMCLSMCLAAAGTSLVLSGCHGARQQAETAAKNAKERRILADRHREKAEKEMRQALLEKQEALRRADDDRRRKIFAEKAAEAAVKEREQFARNSKNAEMAKQEAVSAMLEAQKLAKRMQNDIKGGEKRIQKLEKAKRKAEKRAKANSLSHYILQKLQARDRARENSQIPESDIPNKENNRQ